MKEIVSLRLDNEMDLMLANKRAMKMCELTGMTIIPQTTIATAISEVARGAIEHGKQAELILAIDQESNRKYLKAIVRDSVDFISKSSESMAYARKLSHDMEIIKMPPAYRVILKYPLAFGGTFTDLRIKSFVEYFKNEPPLSAYDELKKKNLLLHELSEQLRLSEHQYKNLSDTLPVMMFSTNEWGVINFTNRWLKEFLGEIPRDLSYISWEQFLHEKDYDRFATEFENVLQRKAGTEGQFRFKHKNGQYFWHLISIVPNKNEKGQSTSWTGFIVNVHDQKVAEETARRNEQLQQAQKQLYRNQEDLERRIIDLNRSNYELEQFAHIASHDLQEPLRKIFFNSDVLQKKHAASLDQNAQRMLHGMTAAAGRMKELINDLLSYSQLNQQTLIMENVNLNEVIDSVLKDFELTIADKSATINVGQLPLIVGNVNRIRQLFANLISNSLKYVKTETAPVIDISAETSNGSVSVRVRDNGIGFDAEYKEKIFGLFERLHTRNEFPGTGIGLAICKRIVEMHNGTIAADSIPGEYADFEVTLPVEPSAQV
ncbi:ATP-binding protein [Chryseolinea sp. T2]|uniref:ATP-binding protein n=1 Tax=Chryseolinea sp. T2 TaxID=3129255 RepID=UPI00307880EB